MEKIYEVAYIATIAVLGICVISSYRNAKHIAVTVRRVLGAAMLAIGMNLFFLYSERLDVCTIFYSIYAIIVDWMLYFLLAFSIEYAGYKMEDYVRKKLMWALLAADSVSLALNIWLGHAFSFEQIVLRSGSVYYKIMPHLFYGIHLIIAYSLVLFTGITLIYKAYKSPSLYRGKYLTVMFLLVLVVVLNVLYLFAEESIDVSILFYAFAGISIYYYALIYTPKELLSRTMTLVARGMTDTLIIMDIDSVCIYANEKAEQLLNIKGGDFPNKDGRYQEWFDKLHNDSCKNFVKDIVIKGDERELELRVQAHRLEDNDQRYMGSFFIVRDRTEEAKRLREEFYRASHDSLTGLYNKEYFYEKAEKCIREHPEEEYLMVCSDIRNFKLVNDLFGTKAGDELLIRIAHVLREKAIPGEVYGRLGNDRFGLLMKKSDFREEIFDSGSESIVNLVKGASYPLKVYVGVYDIVTPFIPISVMCDRALMALKTIKGDYQKKVAYYNEELREKTLWERELSGELQEALEREQFRIFLQPQVSGDGTVRGAEALVRWFHPGKGVIMPGEFIPIFERSGTIAKLDQRVWELACKQLKKWREQGRTDFYLSVNISAKDFYFMDVYGILTDLTRQYEIPPSSLKLEITEKAVIMNPERQIELIQKLRNAGFIIVIDDFGSGYASLNMLEDIKADILKIDMAFFEGTGEKEHFRKILPMLVNMSNQLELQIISERVETQEQAEYLKEIGINMFQGYYFAKPMEVSQFEEQYM